MGVVSSVASPSGVAPQICTETRQSLNGLTAHSPSGCLCSTLSRGCGFLLVRGPLTVWYGCLWLYHYDFLDGKNAFSCCQGKNSGTKALFSGWLPPSWPRGEEAPLGCWCALSLPAWQVRRGLRRATEPVCSLQVYRLRRAVPKHSEPVLYYLLEG